jgi:hypothetical protein
MSLGIGHFIWYADGKRGPYDESFPRLIAFLQAGGVKLPKWLSPETPCPWHSQKEFSTNFNAKRMIELRALLAKTVPQQTKFLIQRLESALPLLMERSNNGEIVKKRFYQVINSGAAGRFALIDYVNFKGEGVLDSERYNGRGWGLLQVLEGMTGNGDVVSDFSNSAKKVLAARVQASPPQRHEERWLPGWTKRVESYAKGRLTANQSKQL